MFVGYLLKEPELGFQNDNNANTGNIVLYLY